MDRNCVVVYVNMAELLPMCSPEQANWYGILEFNVPPRAGEKNQ